MNRLPARTRKLETRSIELLSRVWVLIAFQAFFFVAGNLHIVCADTDSERPYQVNRKEVALWESKLSSNDYHEREAAMEELFTAHPVNIPLLAELCAHADEEVAWRAQTAAIGLFPRLQHAEGEELMRALTLRAKQSAQLRESPPVDLTRLKLKLESRRQLIAAQLHEIGMEAKVLSTGSQQVRFTKPIRISEQLFLQLSSIRKLSTLNLEGQPVTDADLKHMRYLPGTEKLYLMGTQIEGEGLKHLVDFEKLVGLSLRKLNLKGNAFDHLGQISHLKYLGLDETNTTDGDLKKIESLKKLQQLWLNDTKVTDEGFKSLAELTNLEKLILTRISTNGSGLKQLAGLKKLSYLSLEGCAIDDSYGEHFAQLGSLETLGLDKTKVSDKTISEIKSLKNLKVLWLSETQITDSCVPDLLEMDELERLILFDCRISPKAIGRLKVGLPKCVIEYQ